MHVSPAVRPEVWSGVQLSWASIMGWARRFCLKEKPKKFGAPLKQQDTRYLKSYLGVKGERSPPNRTLSTWQLGSECLEPRA